MVRQTTRTGHARRCHRSGAQVNQHQHLVHALFRTFKHMSTCHRVESGAAFNADGDLQTDKGIERGGFRDPTASKYRSKAIILDVAYADPQAVGYMRAGSASRDGLAASKSEARKCCHYPRPRQVSFDARSYERTTLGAENVEDPRKGVKRLD